MKKPDSLHYIYRNLQSKRDRDQIAMVKELILYSITSIRVNNKIKVYIKHKQYNLNVKKFKQTLSLFCYVL